MSNQMKLTLTSDQLPDLSNVPKCPVVLSDPQSQWTQTQTRLPPCTRPTQLINPQPSPIKLGENTQFGWNFESRMSRDCCAVNANEKSSQQTGNYQLTGYDPYCHPQVQYADRMNEIMHFQKVYRNTTCHVSEENTLIYPKLNNFRDIQQLPNSYQIGYQGPGTPSLENKELESAMQQGVITNIKQRMFNPRSEEHASRFHYLPECGHPQRVSHIVPPPVNLGGWIRGGDSTRDHVRQVDGHKRFTNKINKLSIHKGQQLLP